MQSNHRLNTKKWFNRLPLVVVLTVPVITEWLIVVGLISYFSIRNGQQEVNSVANQLQSEITALITDEIEEFLETPHQINKLNENEIHEQINHDHEVIPEDLQHYFWHEIQIFDTVTSIYYGTIDGGLIGSGREGAGGEYYLTQTEDYKKGTFQKFGIDAEGNPADLLFSLPDFDTRTRPWYTGAVEKGDATWSDVYILSTGQDLAIAASQPVYDHDDQFIGVVSVDLFLSHIDELLKHIQIGKSGQSFLMERNGLLLATSKGGMMYSLEDEVLRVAAPESDDLVIQQSAKSILDVYGDFSEISSAGQHTFTIDGENYIYQVMPIKDEYGINWLIVVVSPESDFLAHYIQNTRSTLSIIILTLLMTVVLNVITARWIIRPIDNLVTATQSLAEGDWEKSVPTNENWIREIFDLTTSFNSMTVQLRKLVQDLKLEIIERTHTQDALKTSEDQLKQAQAIAHIGSWTWNMATEEVTLSDEMQRIYGFKPGELETDIFQIINDFTHPEDMEKVLSAARSAQKGEFPESIVYRIIRKDGAVRHVMSQTGESTYDENGVSLITSGILADITDQKLAEEKLVHMATHDALTDLPNRELFNDRLRHAISRAKRYRKKLAVMFLDLDNFKTVNDAFGHKQGDWLLKLITERISQCVRESDTIARIGGDEFIILLEDMNHVDDILPIAEKIINSVAEPFTIENSEVFITSSIGISIYPNDGLDPEMLLSNADRAMYKSKQEGKNKFSLYSSELRTQVLQRLQLRNQLRQAIQNNELVLHYQPKVDLCNDRIIAVESLIRWNHPTRGLLGPDQFIQLAEESGLIVPITDWVLETACTQLKMWLDKGIPPIRVAVNFSGRDLNRDDIVLSTKQILVKAGIPPELLVVELTENIIFQRIERAQSILEEFKKIGVMLAIDDFGSGYSTLSQLAHFAFDTIKIDRHFAFRILESEKDQAIVDGMVTIARNLGMDVIVEGVETREQLAFYSEIGCMQFQGWLFAKPMPADEVEPLLKDGKVPYSDK